VRVVAAQEQQAHQVRAQVLLLVLVVLAVLA
jgi:hypothetical protein